MHIYILHIYYYYCYYYYTCKDYSDTVITMLRATLQKVMSHIYSFDSSHLFYRVGQKTEHF